MSHLSDEELRRRAESRRRRDEEHRHRMIGRSDAGGGLMNPLTQSALFTWVMTTEALIHAVAAMTLAVRRIVAAVAVAIKALQSSSTGGLDDVYSDQPFQAM